MKSRFKERLERLGPVRDVPRVDSGSSVVVSLRPVTNLKVKTVPAALALAKRGLSLLRAKRAVEEMLSTGRAVVKLPTVEDQSTLRAELAKLGVRTRSVGERDVDIRRLRESLNLTQEQFALRYGIDLDTLQNWERNRRKPDQAVRSYLRVIERMPGPASDAQEDGDGPQTLPRQ
jgi:putative transcriptional regulator